MTRRLRILQITHRMGIGGLERVVETLTRTIDSSRFDVALLCLREAGRFAQPLLDMGIRVETIRSHPERTEHLGFLKVARFMREWRPDVIHTHNTEPFLDGTAGALLTGVRTLVHTDHARAFPDKFRYIAAERVASTFAYRVVGVSDDATENLRRYVHIPSRKLLTIENGVDATPFEQAPPREAARQRLELDPTAPVIGLAARLEEQKGLEYLLQAMPQVLREHPTCTLVIAGTGSQEAALKSLAHELGIDRSVRFLGAWFDVPLLTRALDLFLIPSVWEGLPMALLEAMAAGCPVLASTVGGMPVALRHGESGWLVPPKDVPALASGISELLRQPDRRAAFAAAARETFRNRYSAASMARRYEALYERRPADAK